MACRDRMDAVLTNPRATGFVCMPIAAGEHWTLIILSRKACPDEQPVANRLEVTYKDSLRSMSKACLARARLGLAFLVQVVGPGVLAQEISPASAPTTKQDDVHSCGFFCLNWLEEEYRVWRGEGVMVLPEVFQQRASDLSRFFPQCHDFSLSG